MFTNLVVCRSVAVGRSGPRAIMNFEHEILHVSTPPNSAKLAAKLFAEM